MNTVRLIVLVALLQTALGTPWDSSEPFPLETLRPVSLFDTSFANAAPEASRWTNARRELVATDTESCIWNSNASVCLVSPSAKMDILRSANSALAEIWLHDLECQTSGTDEGQCNELETCAWQRSTEKCDFVGHLDQYPDSPCVTNAPLALSYIHLSLKCATHDSAESCAEREGCTWFEKIDLCYADYYHIMFGVKSRGAFTADYGEVANIKMTAALAEVVRQANSFSKKSDWDSLRSMKMPKTDCPSEYTQLVCDYVDVYLKHIFSSFVYCRSRYEKAPRGKCKADPLCNYVIDQGCIHSKKAIHEGLAEADEVLLDSIPSTADRGLTQQALYCGRIRKKANCPENCVWEEDSCTVERNYTFRQFLLGVDLNTVDPICASYQVQLDSGCLELKTNATCSKNENCGWREQTQECLITDDLTERLVIGEDPKMKRPFRRANKKCHTIDDAQVCLEA